MPMLPKILVVDDEDSIRKTLREILEMEDYEVLEAKDGIDALAKVKQLKFDLVISDIKMPKMDGVDLLEKIHLLYPELPVIMISGHGDIDLAVDTVKKGAFDYIAKPPDLNRLLITIRNAIDKSSLLTEAKVLKKKITKNKTQEIVGNSIAIKRIKETIEKIAKTDSRVLVNGPNGTGKELVARWIHENSLRLDELLVEVNCAAIPSELIESELFGHEKGAFTSAIKQRIGKFEQAHGGTLFLDEIGDMSLSAQAKVLRALQEHKITRVGGDKDLKVDVRVIAATNKDLRKEIEEGRFREDLYHRLAVIIIQVPALNERREDIPLLIEYFLNQIAEESGKVRKNIQPEAVEILSSMEWSGNIRELRNVMERLSILSENQITKEDVDHFVVPNTPKLSLRKFFHAFQSFEDFIEFSKEEWKKSKP
jgi:two-component system nitrogen regulation response regulator NtrX